MNNTPFPEIHYDPAITIDSKVRRLKEAFQIFRQACNLQDAITTLELAKTPSEKMKILYLAASLELTTQRDLLIKDAIERYQLSQKGDQIGIPK
jgi:hypothetical protein